jgi:predicted regulator of Ras-like GTPase activity (Roadblock/LC7/MglB family)
LDGWVLSVFLQGNSFRHRTSRLGPNRECAQRLLPLDTESVDRLALLGVDNFMPLSESGLTVYEGVLEELLTASQALTALLITRQGTVVASAGDTTYFNTTAMAALIAGMFTATREVARMVGENQFSILLQQGELRHIHISLVTDDTMLIIVFEDHNRIGLIRHSARKMGERLTTALASARETERAGGEIVLPQFKEYALNLIDQIFQP